MARQMQPIKKDDPVISGVSGNVTSVRAREWFAAMAMQGMLANPDSSGIRVNKVAVAEAAFEIADAMIVASQKSFTTNK
jgi:hypothetical protein